jgi:DNA primase
MNAATILDRLDGVRETGRGRWLARCPAHEDRYPSLSIRELDDGRVLLHCFAGCEIGDVIGEIGLAMTDLFPERLEKVRQGLGYRATNSRIPAIDLLKVISAEVTVIAVIANDMLTRGSIRPQDWPRLVQAASRIGRARDHVG